MTDKFEGEIQRLTALQKKTNDKIKNKLQMCDMFEAMFKDNLPQDYQKKRQAIKNYGIASHRFIIYKILLWSALKNKDKYMWDKTYSEDKMNEIMLEWAECGWEYLGEGDMEETSKSMKEEFEFFKIINQNFNSIIN